MYLWHLRCVKNDSEHVNNQLKAYLMMYNGESEWYWQDQNKQIQKQTIAHNETRTVKANSIKVNTGHLKTIWPICSLFLFSIWSSNVNYLFCISVFQSLHPFGLWFGFDLINSKGLYWHESIKTILPKRQWWSMIWRGLFCHNTKTFWVCPQRLHFAW